MRTKVIQLIIVIVTSTLALSAVFLLVNPREKPLPYIILPVVIVWILLFSVLRALALIVRKRETRLTKIILFSVTSMAVLLLLLAGIGQLQPVDIALVSALAILLSFYFYRSWS